MGYREKKPDPVSGAVANNTTKEGISIYVTSYITKGQIDTKTLLVGVS